MPLQDNITLTPKDILRIQERIQNAQHTGPFTIISTNGSITIRDINGMFIAIVQREQFQQADG